MMTSATVTQNGWLDDSLCPKLRPLRLVMSSMATLL